MDSTRWTLGVVLAAAVSLWGLVEADASPFSSYVLSDDLGNMVRGTAAEASDWDDGSGAGDDSGGGDSGDDSSGNGNGNNGHGNNDDGVDSSNPGQGNGGPNGEEDASCPEGGECVDDESGGGSDSSDDSSGNNGNGNGNGKKK